MVREYLLVMQNTDIYQVLTTQHKEGTEMNLIHIPGIPCQHMGPTNSATSNGRTTIKLLHLQQSQNREDQIIIYLINHIFQIKEITVNIIWK